MISTATDGPTPDDRQPERLKLFKTTIKTETQTVSKLNAMTPHRLFRRDLFRFMTQITGSGRFF